MRLPRPGILRLILTSRRGRRQRGQPFSGMRITPPRCLVRPGPVCPGSLARGQVAPPHGARLARPHAGQQLEADQPGHRPRQVGEGLLDVLHRDRADWLGLSRGRPALLEPRDGREGLDHGRGHQLNRGGPLEGPADAFDPGVDRGAGQAGADHLVPERPESERPEVAGQRAGVERPERLEGGLEVHQFARWCAVGHPVVDLGVSPESEDDLGDGGPGEGEGGREVGARGPSAVAEPSGDQAIILGPALERVPGTEIMGPAVEHDDGPTGGLVQAVGGDSVVPGHGTLP